MKLKKRCPYSYQKFLLKFCFLVVILGGLLGIKQAQAMEIYNKDENTLNLWGRVQFLGQGTYVPNETLRKPLRAYVYLPQSRLGVNGHLGDWNYYTELAFGGEEAVTSNVALALLDFRFDVPLAKDSFLRIGQFKVFNSREWAADDGGLQFANRSIANLGTNFGRDVGVAFAAKTAGFSAGLGVFTGGGMDVPQRYLPEDLGLPLLVARVGLDGTNEDALYYKPAGIFKLEGSSEAAFYLNATYLQDTLIGHSTVLNARVPYDRSLIGNSNWNPYLAATPLQKSTYTTVGFDALYRAMIFEDMVLAAEAQFDMDMFFNSYGSLRTYDARLQASLAKKPYEFAFRVAALIPDGNFTYGTTTLKAGSTSGTPNIPLTGGSQPIYEVTPAFTWWIKDWSRIILQGTVLVNTPVLDDSISGSYVAMEMPDETGYKGTESRQIVPEFRAMWQMQF